MVQISREEFFAKIAASGVGLDDRYAPPQTLAFVPDLGEWARWACPNEPARTVRLLASTLDALGPWRTCWLWKRAGFWHGRPDAQGDLPDTVLALQLAWLDLPRQFDGALEASEADAGRIVAVCYSYFTLGRSMYDDITVIPEAGDAMVQTSHDGELIITARSANRLDQIAALLRGKGFEPEL